MANPPFNIDQTKPADTDAVSAFPANERANRDIIESMYAIEHDVASGRHKIGTGSSSARNAITDWVVGSLWLNTDFTPAMLQRVVSIGPVVWRDVGAFEAVTGARVFNEDGADVDLRMEGDTDANLVFLDAGLDMVGIGGAPTAGEGKLQVRTGALWVSDGRTYSHFAQASLAQNAFATIVPDAAVEAAPTGRVWLVIANGGASANDRLAVAFVHHRVISATVTPIQADLVTSANIAITVDTTNGIRMQNLNASTNTCRGSAFILNA